MVKMDVKACFISYFFIGISFINQNTFAIDTYLQPATWKGRCATGKQQSPINIDTKTTTITKDLPPLKVTYQITDAVLSTWGLGARLYLGSKNELLLDGRTYKLNGLIWHTPSEHTINGKTATTISTVYQIGAPDPIISLIEPEITKLAKEMGSVEEISNKKLREIVPTDKFPVNFLNKITSGSYMAYRGSLTYPPCLEDVKWFLTDPQTMTLEQAKLINSLQSKSNKANSRPTQPLNGRPVLVKMK